MKQGNIRYNGSGYRDDTAFRAICNVIREEKRAKRNGTDYCKSRGSYACNNAYNLVGDTAAVGGGYAAELG